MFYYDWYRETLFSVCCNDFSLIRKRSMNYIRVVHLWCEAKHFCRLTAVTDLLLLSRLVAMTHSSLRWLSAWMCNSIICNSHTHIHIKWNEWLLLIEKQAVVIEYSNLEKISLFSLLKHLIRKSKWGSCIEIWGILSNSIPS